jgi:hypothetical protein
MSLWQVPRIVEDPYMTPEVVPGPSQSVPEQALEHPVGVTELELEK